MSDLLKLTQDSERKVNFVLDREKFRAKFPQIYEGLKQNDFLETYIRLFRVYEHNSKLIPTEPIPKKPEEFDRQINDLDVLDLEYCVAMMFTIGLNVLGIALDSSANRPFIPRDPTTDDSYETAKKILSRGK